MIEYKTLILKFDEKGEKTFWEYIDVPHDIAEQLNPGIRVSYKVKGFLDNYAIKGVSLLPMGGGNFIIPMNNATRKGTKKTYGAMLDVKLELDKAPYVLNKDLVECLSQEINAEIQFYKQAKSHQNYFSKWIDSAKTESTKAKRIVLTIDAMLKKWDYGKMIRNSRGKE